MPSPSPESWYRQPGETARSYNAFKVYRGEQMAGELSAPGIRNLRKLSERIGISYGVLMNWSSQFKWRARALDFDNFIDHNEKAELEHMAREVGRRFRRLRIQEADALYELVGIIRAKVREMDDAAKERLWRTKSTDDEVVSEETSEDGMTKTTILRRVVIEPAGWRVRDIALMAMQSTRLADMMFQLALGPEGGTGAPDEESEVEGGSMPPSHAAAGLGAIMEQLEKEIAGQNGTTNGNGKRKSK